MILLAAVRPAWADRAAAERLAAEATQSHDDAAFVRCGQTFLELYRQDPAAPDADEVLFNAARCFQEGKSISAALQTDSVISKSFPRSKLAGKSMVLAGSMFEQIVVYDRAAEQFEAYARKFAGEKDAIDVLSNAIRLRAALGDVAKQTSDTNELINDFGAQQPARAAAAQFALLAGLEGDRAIGLLRDYLKSYAAVDPNRTIVARVELADRLRAKSCSVPGIDQLCVKLVRDHGPRCGSGTTSVVAVNRTAENREATAEYRAAIALFEHAPAPEAASRHAQAMARLALADDDLETLIASALPRDLDVGAADPAKRTRSAKRFSAWFDAEQQLATRASKQYGEVLAQHDVTTAVAAAARAGKSSVTFYRAIMDSEIPKNMLAQPQHDAYCKALQSSAEPLRLHAIEAFSTCLVKARELDAGQAWANVCLREGAELEPQAFIGVPELRASVALFSPPIAVEPPSP